LPRGVEYYMDEMKHELVKAWLIKAVHDLAAAEKLGQVPGNRSGGSNNHKQPFLFPTQPPNVIL
jgi:hypothetical protein